MNPTLADQRTAQFYNWELRCRGWQTYDAPVELEPTFEPFTFRPRPTAHTDDGLRPTIASSIIDFFAGKTKPQKETENDEEISPALAPYTFENDMPLRGLQVAFQKGRRVESRETEQLLCMLTYCRYPLSFEIIATHTSIVIQIVCREPDLPHVRGQIKAFFPDCVLQDSTETVLDIVPDLGFAYIIDFGLSEEFMRPIVMPERFSLDPFIGLFGTLENLKKDEQIVVQVLFQGAVNSWAESIIHSVSDNDGKSFFIDAPEMIDLAHEKISCPLYAVTIRVVTQAQTDEEARQLILNTVNTITHLSRSTANTLLPLATEAYSFELRLQDIVLRQSHRQGMILNSRELSTLVHFPSDSVVSSKLVRDVKKTKAPPDMALGHDLYLGTTTHQGKEYGASISDAHRLKHTHVIGATGTGKSTFLLNLIVEDIIHGKGIGVLDPHGDLIESILSYIPPERINDVVLIDPSDSEFPVWFNILSAHSEIEKIILSSDLVAVFRKFSTSWGDQMNSVFGNAILAFLESNEGGTLSDLRRFLVEKNFRETYLKTVTDPSIVYYWQKEFPLLKSSSIGPILTRLDTFLRPKLIRYMVAQKRGPDFEQILDTKKILLVKLSQGLIGAENSYILGAFIVSKIQQAAMSRQAKGIENRSDFFLYIDEFQNFITPSMKTILSGARKYHLGLILAHQDMQQLAQEDRELANSVLSNAGTRVCFRIGDSDAKSLENGFSYFEAKDLQNLDTGEAIVRIDRPEYDFAISTTPIPALDSKTAEAIRNAVIARSREQYGTPRKEVEKIFETLNEAAIPIPEKKEAVPIVEVQEIQPIIQQATYTPRKPAEKKEQSQHRYLQTLIKKMAESRGYKASIEEPTPDGKGRVDVALERKGMKIACEISVTNADIYEVHNIEKCLTAGYDLVIACSTERKTLDKIRKAAEENLPFSSLEKILIADPEEFFLYLDKQVAKDASTETLIKGYRVKVEYDTVSEREMQRKRDTISEMIAKSKKK